MAKELIYTPRRGIPANATGFMSWSGTNLVEILKLERKLEETMGTSPFKMNLIVTDNPASNAAKIADKWKIKCVTFDIKEFNKARGVKKLTLKTEEGRQARAEYTEELKKLLTPYDIDFGIFGGFKPLTNIMKMFPCLNIHPGGLDYLKDGERYLVGLDTVPIERALSEGLDYLRSSVILATPYKGAGENMDDGPLVGLGPKLMIGDEKNSDTLQDKLKEASDWKIFPKAVLAVALGNIEVDYETNEVYYKGKKGPIIMD